MPEAARTLVKSPPELWAEVSDAQSLARHLGAAGEIRITRLDPESTVAWEGDRIRGTVDLAPAGWGTKVTVTAEEVAQAVAEPPAEVGGSDAPQAAPAPAPAPAEDEPAAAADARPRGLRGLLARVFGRREAPQPATEDQPQAAIASPDGQPAPEPAAAPDPAPEPEPAPAADPAALLDDMLGSLGAAHHRPFSR